VQRAEALLGVGAGIAGIVAFADTRYLRAFTAIVNAVAFITHASQSRPHPTAWLLGVAATSSGAAALLSSLLRGSAPAVVVSGLATAMFGAGTVALRRMYSDRRRLPGAVAAQVRQLAHEPRNRRLHRVAVRLADGRWYRNVHVIAGEYVHARGGTPPFDPRDVVAVAPDADVPPSVHRQM
jgi:hypothetical protein